MLVATIIVAVVTIALISAGFVFFRLVKGPVRDWYFRLLEKSKHSARAIRKFGYIDILWTAIFAGIVFFLLYALSFGYLIAEIITGLFLIYRCFFYKQHFTGIFLDIIRDRKAMKRDKAYDLISVFLLLFFVLLILIPLMNLVARAFSDGRFNSVVTFVPVGFTFYSFKYILTSAPFWQATGNSVLYVVLVTIFSNLIASLAGYVLSKPDFPLRRTFLIIFIITMLFSPGIIPIYLMMSGLSLLNSVWSYILISFSNVFNMLLFKTAFEGIPPEIEESAEMDGCSPLRMFFQIVLPITVPTFASCAFFSIVGAWNGYGAALMFVSSAHQEAMPLALYIYYLLEQLANSNSLSTDAMIYVENIKAASIIITVIPILVIYPYIIKYIKTGITIGSVK